MVIFITVVITGSDKGRRGALDIWSLGCCILEMATGRRPWANLDNEWAVCFHVFAVLIVDHVSYCGFASSYTPHPGTNV
jgi:serine/threonine protein kinase